MSKRAKTLLLATGLAIILIAVAAIAGLLIHWYLLPRLSAHWQSALIAIAGALIAAVGLIRGVFAIVGINLRQLLTPQEPPSAQLQSPVTIGHVGRGIRESVIGTGPVHDIHFGDKIVYETTAPMIPAPFSLPADLVDFTGRHSDINKVRKRLQQEGAPVISGMGGIGKTALALHVAHQLAAGGRFRDAQLYLDLKGMDPLPLDPAAALQTLLSDLLGPGPQRPTDVNALSDLWRQTIYGKDAVLILDNAADVGQVRPLLPGCPTCAVLVTSRRRFTLPGAELLDLDPMDPADARSLLQRLAPRLDDRDADAIAKLCGHLPLALRVAGNYLALNDDVSPDQYATRLADERDRLAHLRHPDDPDLDVEATIILSVAQLTDDARRAWALLALFPVPFDLAAAAALWDQPNESAGLERLQALRNRSLVSYDGETRRYGQHELLRLAAARELADSVAAGIPAARDCLARHYLAVAQEVDETQRYLDLDPDWPHLRAALEHAAASNDVDLLSDLVHTLAPYISARGLARDKIVWCQRAAETCAAAGRRHAIVDHLHSLGVGYAEVGEFRKAIEQHQAVLAIAREIGDRHMEGSALGSQGHAYGRLGEVQKAIEYHDAALAIAQEIGDRRAEGEALGNLGVAYAGLGKAREAILHYEGVLGIVEEIGDRRMEAQARGNLGTVYRNLGKRRKAIEHDKAALAIAQDLGDRRQEGYWLGSLGMDYLDLGKVRKAIEQYEAALTISRQIGDRHMEGHHLANLGLAYARLGDLARARRMWSRSLTILEAIEDPIAEGIRLLRASPDWSFRITGCMARLGFVPILRLWLGG